MQPRVASPLLRIEVTKLQRPSSRHENAGYSCQNVATEMIVSVQQMISSGIPTRR